MATERQRARCRDRLKRLGQSSLDGEAVRREAIADLRHVVGFDRWCWPLADPATAIPLSGLAEHDYGPRLPRALELEFSGNDFAAKHVVARRRDGVGSLSSETGGDLARSPRWDEVLRPVGIGDIATAACRDALGCWGWVEAYRDGGDRAFDAGELELLADVGQGFAAALRRTWTSARGSAPEPSPTGVVVLDGSLQVLTWTAGARAWVEAFRAANLFAAWGTLPPVVYAVATMSRSTPTTRDAHALERTADGRWLTIEASPLEGSGDRVAVTFRAATPAETFDLLCRAYALSPRERDVVEMLIAGIDTVALAARLFISRHTVQDHLKSVFDKMGVRSRRELLATFNVSA